ncbi:hypothetical protein [Methylophilus sp. DW102]|jgi:hypothetical protein|uniref:hypothetical protein n=1 Tax=Methylophilus sp. DW102 TaxID=3095607 RepID=UPI00308730C7|nr:hypothetical protein MTDW_26300 [Methylophilus sp. DW102]
MSSNKRTVLVTIEKELEIEFTPAVLGDMTEQEYLEHFSRYLWQVESMDDVFKYAAEVAAKFGSGLTHDGLGLVSCHYSKYPREPDVKFREISDECEVEIIQQKQPS